MTQLHHGASRCVGGGFELPSFKHKPTIASAYITTCKFSREKASYEKDLPLQMASRTWLSHFALKETRMRDSS